MATTKHPLVHNIGGKDATVGHAVHYTDHAGEVHAAVITHINPETHDTSLHVLHRGGGTGDQHFVAHSAEGAPHSWNHIPVK